MVFRRNLYVGIVVGVVVCITTIGFFIRSAWKPRLSTNLIEREFQIIGKAVNSRKSPALVLHDEIRHEIETDFPPAAEERRSSDIALYRYIYSGNTNNQSLGAVGLITDWNKTTSRLTITNIDQQDLVFDLSPDPNRPIYEAELLSETGKITPGTNLSYHLCEYGDLVEVLWNNTKDISEIMTADGKISIQNLGVIRPDGIVFYHRKPECFNQYL